MPRSPGGGRYHPRLNRLDYCRCFDVALATPRFCLSFPRPTQSLCGSAVPYESILTRRTDPGSSQNGKASREPWAVALQQYLQNLESLLMSEGHSLKSHRSPHGANVPLFRSTGTTGQDCSPREVHVRNICLLALEALIDLEAPLGQELIA